MDALPELEQKSEAVEREALISTYECCWGEVREALGLELHEIEDGLCMVARHDPSILLNRTLGLGSRRPVSASALERVEAIYQRAGVKKAFVHVYPETAPEAQSLGFEKARAWRKFNRRAGPVQQDLRSCELRVQRVGPERAEHFARIAAPGFGLTEASIDLVAALARDERWWLFVTYDGDTPAGTGAMMVVDDCALFEWAATAPQFRRRGSQGLVMRARLEAAQEVGCQFMFTETGEAVPGDPQHSYRNIQRYGFEEGALRQNWIVPRG